MISQKLIDSASEQWEAVYVISRKHEGGHPKTSVRFTAKDLLTRPNSDERPVGIGRHTATIYLCDV